MGQYPSLQNLNLELHFVELQILRHVGFGLDRREHTEDHVVVPDSSEDFQWSGPVCYCVVTGTDVPSLSHSWSSFPPIHPSDW